jgi:3-isopropylmalate/(R)-2-methylmalate dehydratase small subunit
VPIFLPASEVEALFQQVEAMPGYKLMVDLPAQAVIRPDGYGIPCPIDAFRKRCLINGCNDIGLTLHHAAKIGNFRKNGVSTGPGCSRNKETT